MNIGYGLLLSTLAGLATAIGGVIALFMYRPKRGYLALFLGFSAGVMLHISFVELLPTTVAHLGALRGNLVFFIGLGFIALLDLVIPHEYKEEKMEPVQGKLDLPAGVRHSSTLMRVGLLTGLGMAIHNFPEGLAVFGSAIGGDKVLGLAVAIAVGMHNIPEGISVFIPIFAGSGSRKRAFLYTFFAGIAEPIGALLGYAILLPFLTPNLVYGLLAFAGGIMVYISLDELLPAAHRFGEAHFAIIGVMAGMLFMAISLTLLGT